ncbi:hypothetical protein A1351_20325 [Methylosinus sp. R-45379]|uniref:hypothetical protein n=1 Tax=Methylosinus sp. R-45379 TaxID=980563 RepID=UPI0007C92BDD|nr:hypothetical protein [Methylosinus sp. R-45379]OAI22917.1 hypothetical protein A1351_20325 [Methylosinus sp. R-45379]
MGDRASAHAKRIADKYISETGDAPAPSARWARPDRVGGVWLKEGDLRRVAQIFDFLDVVSVRGAQAYSKGFAKSEKAGLREHAAASRKALAELIGATEDDLRGSATIYLRVHR